MLHQASHTQYVISGRIRVNLNDGNEGEYGAGDVAYIPFGHNAWIAGNDPYTGIEFGPMDIYAKK